MDLFAEILSSWYASAAALAVCILIRHFYRNFVLIFLRRATKATPTPYDDDILAAFEQPVNIVIITLGLYAALRLSPLAWLQRAPIADSILRSVIVFCFFWGCYNISDTTKGLMSEFLTRFGIRAEASITNICSTIVRILIVLFAFAAIAKEWNYDISGFAASLGIGSLAIAFAAKDALANVFGSLVNILDKPFQIGDWIAANGIEGTVEEISFRSTCIRTFPQELVYVPNSLMSNTPITNFTRREKRRIDFIIGLTYGTSSAQIENFTESLRSYLASLEELLYTDNISVHFIAYGDSSLNVRVICYARTGLQAEYLNTLQTINLALMRIMEECGVSCAFPSTSVYFETPLPAQGKDA